jgi:hypothetical protein
MAEAKNKFELSNRILQALVSANDLKTIFSNTELLYKMHKVSYGICVSGFNATNAIHDPVAIDRCRFAGLSRKVGDARREL